MVLAAGLQVWDPEELEFDLVEAAGFLGMAGKDIEGALETIQGFPSCFVVGADVVTKASVLVARVGGGGIVG